MVVGGRHQRLQLKDDPMPAIPTPFIVDRSIPQAWRVIFEDPPLNRLHAAAVSALLHLLAGINADGAVKVVHFHSADPDGGPGDLDPPGDRELAGPRHAPASLALWTDFITRLSQSPVLSVASIRGHARGVGAEFLLACDIRFASPGPLATSGSCADLRLAPVAGPVRAPEIILDCDNVAEALSERYGLNRFLPAAELEPYVDRTVQRLMSFDRPALREAKRRLNRPPGLPTMTQLHEAARDYAGSWKRPAVAMHESVDALGDIMSSPCRGRISGWTAGRSARPLRQRSRGPA